VTCAQAAGRPVTAPGCEALGPRLAIGGGGAAAVRATVAGDRAVGGEETLRVAGGSRPTLFQERFAAEERFRSVKT